MTQTVHTGDTHEVLLHVGRADAKLHLSLVLTNTGDDPITASSMMGSWSSFTLVDEHGRHRLDGMATTAAVTPWTIPPGESLVSRRVPETAEDVDERWNNRDIADTLSIEYVGSVKEYEARGGDDNDDVHLAPTVNFPEDNKTRMTATGSIDLGDYSASLSCEFTPADLPAPLDLDAYTVAEQNRGW